MKTILISFAFLLLGFCSSWATDGYNDLAKLVKSKVNDDIIIAYINSSDVSYAFSADEIIRLKDMGASSMVITAAIRHKKTVAAQSSEQPQPAVAAPVGEANTAVYEYATPPDPYYYSYWQYPGYVDFGWSTPYYYHRDYGRGGNYRGSYGGHAGRVGGGGQPKGWSGAASNRSANHTRTK